MNEGYYYFSSSMLERMEEEINGLLDIIYREVEKQGFFSVDVNLIVNGKYVKKFCTDVNDTVQISDVLGLQNSCSVDDILDNDTFIITDEQIHAADNEQLFYLLLNKVLDELF